MLEQVFRALLGFGHALFVNLAIRPRKRRLDQNVADLGLLRHAILIAMLVVIGLQFVVRHLHAAEFSKDLSWTYLTLRFSGIEFA